MLNLTSFPTTTATYDSNSSEIETACNDYTFVPDFGGYKFHCQAKTWNDARLECKREGGHLVVINSVEEAYVITQLFNASRSGIVDAVYTTYAFVGIHDMFEDGQFVTLDGKTLEEAGYNEWAAGEPNNFRNQPENCGAIKLDGKLNDTQCHLKFAFICECITASTS
ncbi:hemolymph lipopolysaccharide-binding protein-like [Athalia rosae]|uniref:hemolymph lipopolysaccharide-binding protein-like n=1 Tax=Athalia rosae TaxID=37344 RepID=UPI002033D523|nr:hemolymph lipopolysaccharide-binding protein-like [Athalia rosae]